MQKNNNALVKRQLAAVIMAAGKGTRMKDPTKVKVMYEVLGKPMLHYVVDLANALSVSRIVVVVGYQRDVVIQYLNNFHPNAEIAIQAEQLGTGHAVMQTEAVLKDFSGDVVVLSGDVPLLSVDTMRELIDHHNQTSVAATILTADFADPTGYGRIILNNDGSVKKVVEHKDATKEERCIKEINSGIYVFEKQKLFESLKNISPKNVQNEYYLTDVFEYFWKSSWKVSAIKTSHVEEIMGVNTVNQLDEVQQVLLKRKKK
jgi:UDP-N-acetylglucosamine pyrophosphorylase